MYTADPGLAQFAIGWVMLGLAIGLGAWGGRAILRFLRGRR